MSDVDLDVARESEPDDARPPTASELLERPGAVLTTTHLRDLGLTRTMIDKVFLALDVVYFPGSTRGAVKVEDYLQLVERSMYRGDRVRPRAPA